LPLFSILSLEKSKASTVDEQLFWGTYRPFPYVGLRSRSHDSPLVGLMWYKPSLTPGVGMNQIRHTCSYYDQLTKFGWEEHDGLSYGSQTLSDPQNGANLKVQWIKPDL
jgi:mannosyl-oligosaccharide glucosidase